MSSELELLITCNTDLGGKPYTQFFLFSFEVMIMVYNYLATGIFSSYL